MITLNFVLAVMVKVIMVSGGQQIISRLLTLFLLSASFQLPVLEHMALAL